MGKGSHVRGVLIDQGIIERAMKGDKEAFSMLVRTTGSRALIVAERILRSPDDAVFAVSKLFVMAYSNLKKLKSLGLLEVWLMQNLVRVCSDSTKDLAKRGLAPEMECSYSESLAAAALLEVSGVAERALPASEAQADLHARKEARRNAVRAAIDCLPFMERTATIFRDWDGISYLEVAEILRVKQDEMRDLLIRGRNGIATMLMAPRESLAEPAKAATEKTSEGSDEKKPKRRKAPRWLEKRRAECQKAQSRLWLFVGGEMGIKEQEELAIHMNQCGDCREYLRRASVTLEAIRDAAPLVDKPLVAPEMLWKEVEPLLAR